MIFGIRIGIALINRIYKFSLVADNSDKIIIRILICNLLSVCSGQILSKEVNSRYGMINFSAVIAEYIDSPSTIESWIAPLQITLQSTPSYNNFMIFLLDP